MKFEVEIRNNIKYIIRHIAGGDLVEIQTPLRQRPIRGFIRKAMVDESELRKSA